MRQAKKWRILDPFSRLILFVQNSKKNQSRSPRGRKRNIYEGYQGSARTSKDRMACLIIGHFITYRKIKTRIRIFNYFLKKS